MKPPNYFRYTVLVPTLISITLTMAFNSTHAAEESILEEVLVTAQKREQSLDDIGITIDAFTGDSLREKGVNSLIDLAQFSPGLNIRGPFGDYSYPIITLRGVNTDGFIETLPQSTGVYTDGIYISQPPMLTLRMFDLERVEVLKGPKVQFTVAIPSPVPLILLPSALLLSQKATSILVMAATNVRVLKALTATNSLKK